LGGRAENNDVTQRPNRGDKKNALIPALGGCLEEKMNGKEIKRGLWVEVTVLRNHRWVKREKKKRVFSRKSMEI